MPQGDVYTDKNWTVGKNIPLKECSEEEDVDSDEYAIVELLRESILENIFSYLYLDDLANCARVCKSWNKILSDGNNYVWKQLSRLILPSSAKRFNPLGRPLTYKDRLRAYLYSWNPNDCSKNIYIKPNAFTLHRNPVAQSTDGCRGKIGFVTGRHAWEVVWQGPLGTVAVVGVSTRNVLLQRCGYVPLLGADSESWGWNLVDNQLLHKAKVQGYFPMMKNSMKFQVSNNKGNYVENKYDSNCRLNVQDMDSEADPESEPDLEVRDRIRVILDCDNRTLSFERNHEFLGVAFRDLPAQRLYPTISAVYGNTEVTLFYLGLPIDG